MLTFHDLLTYVTKCCRYNLRTFSAIFLGWQVDSANFSLLECMGRRWRCTLWGSLISWSGFVLALVLVLVGVVALVLVLLQLIRINLYCAKICNLWEWICIVHWVRFVPCKNGFVLYSGVIICKVRMASWILITKVLIACSGVQDLQLLLRMDGGRNWTMGLEEILPPYKWSFPTFLLGEMFNHIFVYFVSGSIKAE